MQYQFRDADRPGIYYGKTFLLKPKKCNNKWRWLRIMWIQAKCENFDFFIGPRWSFLYLTEDEMVQERLTYNLISNEIKPVVYVIYKV